jgi:hypothetical protein
MKSTERTGNVKHLSVAFDGGGTRLVNSFWEILQRRMRPYVAQYGTFTRTVVEGRKDWVVTFTAGWPEQLLDELLAAVATRLEVQIFIDPGQPAAEMTPDPRAYLFIVDPRRRPPNN